LEAKDAGRRANACEVVGTLRLRACHGMVLAATGDEDANVRVAATRALCVLDPDTAVGVLLGLIEREGSWAADLLADLLQRVPEKAMAAVMQRAREWGATPALVKLLASCPSEVANTVLLSSLETDNPELRARVAEAIQASSPQAIAALATLLTDPHEGTRLSAVRSLGRVSNPKALLTLSSALSDGSRLVRFAAAEGIAGTPGGADLLHRIVVGSDSHAAEAAELALWRLNTDASPAEVGLGVGPGIGVGVSGAFVGVAGISKFASRDGDGVEGDVPFVGLASGDVSIGDVSMGDLAARGIPLSVQLERLTSQLEQADELTFELALASLLDEAARGPLNSLGAFVDAASNGPLGFERDPAQSVGSHVEAFDLDKSQSGRSEQSGLVESEQFDSVVENRDPENLGPENLGPENLGPENLGPENRDPEDVDSENVDSEELVSGGFELVGSDDAWMPIEWSGSQENMVQGWDQEPAW
jgi:hypothetical protein